MNLTKKFFCPVNGWDCPYWKEDGSCSMVDDGDNPLVECDDALVVCCDDPEDGATYDVEGLLELGYHFINGEPIHPLIAFAE